MAPGEYRPQDGPYLGIHQQYMQQYRGSMEQLLKTHNIKQPTETKPVRAFKIGDVVEVGPDIFNWFHGGRPGSGDWLVISGFNEKSSDESYATRCRLVFTHFPTSKRFCGTNSPEYCINLVEPERVNKELSRLAKLEAIRKANRPMSKLIKFSKHFLGGSY